jgi:hypothetical protein
MLHTAQSAGRTCPSILPALRATYNINPGPIAQNPTDRFALASAWKANPDPMNLRAFAPAFSVSSPMDDPFPAS